MNEPIPRLAGGFHVLPVQNRSTVFSSSEREPHVIISRPETHAVHLTPFEARKLAQLLQEAAEVAETRV